MVERTPAVILSSRIAAVSETSPARKETSPAAACEFAFAIPVHQLNTGNELLIRCRFHFEYKVNGPRKNTYLAERAKKQSSCTRAHDAF